MEIFAKNWPLLGFTLRKSENMVQSKVQQKLLYVENVSSHISFRLKKTDRKNIDYKKSYQRKFQGVHIHTPRRERVNSGLLGEIG